MPDAMSSGAAEWSEALGGHVPISPVYDIGEALENPFVADGGRLADFERAEGGDPVRMLVGPIRVNEQTSPTRAAPAMGADTNTILAKLGYGDDQIAALRNKGVV